MHNCGVIEGYFGTPWSFKSRNTYPEFLRKYGYRFFIYAPKNDPFLRKKWDREWSDRYIKVLKNFAGSCHRSGIEFGIGFTPAGDASAVAENPELLLARVREISSVLPLDYFALLFDDLKNNDRSRLAYYQLRIIDLITSELTSVKHFIVCPSYYTTDPVIGRVFGERPENYWNDYADGLDPEVNLFWTGEKVCSDSYSRAHLEWFAEQFRRKPFLWDNYPVNDGKKLADFLFLKPFENRASFLNEYLTGHAVNPMREPHLNKITMSTLGDTYDDRALDTDSELYWQRVTGFTGRKLARCIRDDFRFFTEIGLSGIESDELAELQKKYEKFRSNPYGREIYDYLKGKYAFDPACLTG